MTICFIALVTNTGTGHATLPNLKNPGSNWRAGCWLNSCSATKKRLRLDPSGMAGAVAKPG